MPDEDEDIVVGVVVEECVRPEGGDVPRRLDVDRVAKDLEVVFRETLGVAPTNCLFVFPLPQLDREILPAELLEGELTQVPDSLRVQIVGALYDCLVMGSLSVGLVRSIEIHPASDN